jgi:hypothetical protein
MLGKNEKDEYWPLLKEYGTYYNTTIRTSRHPNSSMNFWDDNERGPYISHKNQTRVIPDMAQVLKEIVMMSWNQDESTEDYEDIDYVNPTMYYEYSDNEIPEYMDDTDDELIEALESEALNEYFEHCYDSLCKNKFAYV